MANSEYCVCCGKEIPEGSQVCIMCGYKAKGKQRQIDRIRKMDVEELARFINGTTTSISVKLNGKYISNEIEYIKQYLESEVEGE